MGRLTFDIGGTHVANVPMLTKSRWYIVAVILVLSCIASAQRPATSNTIKIPIETYNLPNGVTVLLSTDHSIPTVVVAAWYHVGSKNEQVGHTGSAHLFEHVMFTGSGHVPYGLHDKFTEGVGGNNNGSTTNDRTNYYENIPSNYLESALWLESDRIGYLLDNFDNATIHINRALVKNEL